MLETNPIAEYDEPSNAFLGVRFVLVGFDSVREEKVRSKLFEGGGVAAVNYGPDCSHVIVDNVVYDDPICAAARRDDKILVTGLWVDHSYDVGMPVDPTSIMYRPVKDLNGIPGAKSLVMCLTGYQRHDRDDIMTMVSLMGANFSKPLVANKVTHLICYKFEGDKYELGKKVKTIKLVNHRWLQDCLKAWELLPEAGYANKSTYELEMEAEAKDSEEETEDVAPVEVKKKSITSPQNTRVENKNILPSTEGQGVSINSGYLTAFESFTNVGSTSKTQSTPRKETYYGKTSFSREDHDEHPGTSNSSCARSPAKMSSKVPSNEHGLASASESAKKPIDGGLSKLSGKSMKASLPLRLERIENNSRSPSSNVIKPGLGGGLDISPVRCLEGTDSHGIITPLEGTLLCPDEGQAVDLPSKNKPIVPRGSSRSPVLSKSPETLMRSQLPTKPIEMPVTRSSSHPSSPLSPVLRKSPETLLRSQLPTEPIEMPVARSSSHRSSPLSPVISKSPETLMRSQLPTKPIEMPVTRSSSHRSSPLACGVSTTNGTSCSRKDVHGGFVMPSENDRDESEPGGVKTPLKGPLLYPDEEQASTLPCKKNLSVAGGGSKLTELGSSPKILMGCGLDTRQMEMLVSCSPVAAVDVPPTMEEVSGVRDMPSERDQDGLKSGGVTTPLKGASLHLNEEESISLPGKKKMTASRGSSKSKKLSHSTKTLVESGLDTKAIERPVSGSPIHAAHHVPHSNATSHLREDVSPASEEATAISNMEANRQECSDQILKSSRGRPKKQRLSNMDIEGHTLSGTKSCTGKEEMQQSNLLTSEPPFPSSSSRVEKVDGQADLNSSNVDQSGTQSKPLKKKMLARKTLGSRPTICKGSTTKHKGLISTALLKELTKHSNGAVAIENTNNVLSTEGFAVVSPTTNEDVPLGSETEAPECEGRNELGKGSKNSAEVEVPHSGKLTHKRKQHSEKDTQIKGAKSRVKKSNVTETVCSQKDDLPESKSTGDVAEERITEGRKRPLAKSKRNKLNDPTEKKQDAGNPVSHNEETAVLVAKSNTEGKKRPLAKSKRNKLNDPTEENKQDVGNSVSHNEETAVLVAKSNTEGKKRPLAKSKRNKLNNPTEENKQDEGNYVSQNEEMAVLVAKSKTNKLIGSSQVTKQDEKNTVTCNEQMVVLAGKTSKRPSKKLKSSNDVEKENEPVANVHKSASCATGANGKLTSDGIKKPLRSACKVDKAKPKELDTKADPAWFILSGHKLQRKEFQQVIKRLKGRVCRDTHNWSYQATHFIVPDPIRRTEKFFAAAASGSWILKTDYLSASNEAGSFLSEEPYEWHKKCLTEDGAINLEAPRKWRLLREKTGHGAFYGMRIIIYGECIAPPLDTLKRVVKAGDGTILATSPPYTRFLTSRVDFAIVSPGMPRVDMWVQEFLKHEIPCISADYLVEYVCKPGYSLDRHVQYNTQAWAQRSLESLVNRVEEAVEEPKIPEDHLRIDDAACRVCGSRDRGEEMLICGDESGDHGCGVGTHIGCLDPPLEDVPEEDWFCQDCCRKRDSKSTSRSSKKRASKSKK